MGVATLTGRKKYTNGIISKFYIPGTEPKGWYLGCTKEYSEKKKLSTTKKWSEEAYRNKQNKTRNTDEYRNKIKAIGVASWSNKDKKKERCQKLSEAAQRRWDAAERQKVSIKMKNKWSDETYRKNQTIAIKKGHEDIYLKHPEYKDKIAAGNTKTWSEDKINILLKQAFSKDKNGTWNTSKPEQKLYEELIAQYGIDDVEQQYDKDPRYPYRADFYIKSLDLFIELQGTWHHGKHPFNSEDPKDLEIVEKWKEKAKGNPKSQYNGAITIWTIKDVEKRKCAIKNNLNIKFIY